MYVYVSFLVYMYHLIVNNTNITMSATYASPNTIELQTNSSQVIGLTLLKLLISHFNYIL